MNTSKGVDEYIANASEQARPLLDELRELIRNVVPEAEEGLWYSVPFYKYYGELVGFDTFTKHISLGYGKGVVSDEQKKKLEDKGYKLGVGTLQIKFDQKIPTAEVKKIIKTKAKLNEQKPGMDINLQ